MDFLEFLEKIDLIGLAFFIIVIGYTTVRLIYALDSRRKSKNKIKFDEFENISKIKQRERSEEEDIYYESAVISKVYKDAYDKSVSIYGDDTYAEADANRAVERAKKDFENFKFLDSVEVEKESVYEQIPIQLLKEKGNNMEIELFKKWARGIFGCIKIGTEEQLEVVKSFMADNLYSKFVMQAKAFERDGVSFITEDLVINNCFIYDYGSSLDKEEIKVLIEANMKEYIIRNSDNVVLKGSKDKFHEKKVIMTFLKRDSKDLEGMITNCPNCGTATSQVELGKCKYCGTIILPIRYNWVLTKFETM